MSEHQYDRIIVGGGFFGCILACYFAQHGARTLLCERADDLMLRASFANQARVHNGYHYPRSILTALRSRVNFPRFIAEFAECIDRSFDAYYAIPRRSSKVTPAQFAIFMKRIGAPIRVAPAAIKRLFDASAIGEVFHVTEHAFDAVQLREHCRQRLRSTGVDVWLGARACSARACGGQIEVVIARGGVETTIRATGVLNCTYSELNGLLRASGLQPLRLKQELTEMCLVNVPEVLRRVAVTVMCGPFFSLMPFPSRHCHTLSHVRYTPHCSWYDDEHHAVGAYDSFERAVKRSRFQHMIRDASRYLPALREAQYVESLWEVKTVLPQNEVDDARPILLFRHRDLPGLTSILGGKIDNVYDAIAEFDGTEGALP